MSRKLIHVGVALFFFISGCVAASLYMHGEGPELISSAQAGGCYTSLQNTSSTISGNDCVYTIKFNRKVANVQKNGSRVMVTFDNRCQYNCQTLNPASGTCIGPHMNACD